MADVEVLFVRCKLAVVDADAQPPRVEASFDDADGKRVRILDKEPMFTDASDEPGEGWVRCTELRRESDEPDARVWLSLDTPDSLETTEGATVIVMRRRETYRLWCSLP